MSEQPAGTIGPPFGQRVARKEDARLLTGQGRYVADISLPGMLHIAFVRSPYAHARISSIDTSDAEALEGVITVACASDPDLVNVALRAESALPSHVATRQTVLAQEKVRFQGEAVVAVLATDRYIAEDAVELVYVEYEELPPNVGALESFETTGIPVHDAAPDNVLISRVFEAGDVDEVFSRAPLVLDRTFRTNRHGGVPLECRGVVAQWDESTGSLTLTTTSQIPHLHRNGIAKALNLPEHKVRVVVGDVGGGFGVKATLYPEDLVAAVLSQRVNGPVCWIEDRIEHLQTALHARDHRYDVKAAFDADGTLLAVDAVLHADVGAYSCFPWTAGIEPLMAGGLLTGPYKLDHYRCDVRGVSTNTTPTGPYRGVARPATVFVMERLMDEAAQKLGIDPIEIRTSNLISPDDLPYTAPTRLVHDSRTYVACLEEVVAKVDYEVFRRQQVEMWSNGRYIGIGFACYNELTGLGQKASAGPRLPFRTGHECVTVRVSPSGSVSVTAGTTSQGQGLETTLAQVVAAELGIPLDQVDVSMGDTEKIQFGLGAFASRQGVIGSGAATLAGRQIREKILRLAAHLLEADPEWLTIDHGFIHTEDAPAVGVYVRDVAHVAYMEPHKLPAGESPGLESTQFYDPITGTFAAGAQAAIVEVDINTGNIDIQKIVCVEDTGRMINPMIVEGQVEGSIAQGIGGTLYEHFVHDSEGQLVTGTLMDYLIPSAMEIPPIELGHIEDPADNLNGVRGVGEGGTLGPYAAITNAVVDALRPLDISIDELPLSPSSVYEVIEKAKNNAGTA